MKFSSTRTDQGSIDLKPRYNRHWPDWTFGRTVLCSYLLLICHQFLLFAGVYKCILFHYYQNLAPGCKKKKEYLRREKITLFPTRLPKPDQTPNLAKYGPVTWVFLVLHILVQGSPKVLGALLVFSSNGFAHADMILLAIVTVLFESYPVSLLKSFIKVICHWTPCCTYGTSIS